MNMLRKFVDETDRIDRTDGLIAASLMVVVWTVGVLISGESSTLWPVVVAVLLACVGFVARPARARTFRLHRSHRK